MCPLFLAEQFMPRRHDTTSILQPMFGKLRTIETPVMRNVNVIENIASFASIGM